MKIDKQALKDYINNDNLEKYDNEDLIAMMYVSKGSVDDMADYIGCPVGKLWHLISSDVALLEEFGKVMEFERFKLFEQSCQTLETVMSYADNCVSKEYAPNPAVNGAKFVFQNTSALWGINMKVKRGEGAGETEIEVVGDMYKKGVKDMEQDENEDGGEDE